MAPLTLTSEQARALADTGYLEPSYDGLHRPALRLPGWSYGGYVAYKSNGAWHLVSGWREDGPAMAALRAAFAAASLPMPTLSCTAS